MSNAPVPAADPGLPIDPPSLVDAIGQLDEIRRDVAGLGLMARGAGQVASDLALTAPIVDGADRVGEAIEAVRDMLEAVLASDAPTPESGGWPKRGLSAAKVAAFLGEGDLAGEVATILGETDSEMALIFRDYQRADRDVEQNDNGGWAGIALRSALLGRLCTLPSASHRDLAIKARVLRDLVHQNHGETRPAENADHLDRIAFSIAEDLLSTRLADLPATTGPSGQGG